MRAQVMGRLAWARRHWKRLVLALALVYFLGPDLHAEALSGGVTTRQFPAFTDEPYVPSHRRTFPGPTETATIRPARIETTRHPAHFHLSLHLAHPSVRFFDIAVGDQTWIEGFAVCRSPMRDCE